MSLHEREKRDQTHSDNTVDKPVEEWRREARGVGAHVRAQNRGKGEGCHHGTAGSADNGSCQRPGQWCRQFGINASRQGRLGTGLGAAMVLGKEWCA